MEISLFKKNNMKNQNSALSRPISVKKNGIFIYFISFGRVHNQYLKYIEIRMKLMRVNAFII